MKVKFLEKKENKAGTIYGLASRPNGTFGVYVLKNNYNGQVKGGISSSWAYCIKDVDENTARAYFIKMTNGKKKY